jgi:hypothetical protein
LGAKFLRVASARAFGSGLVTQGTRDRWIS